MDAVVASTQPSGESARQRTGSFGSGKVSSCQAVSTGRSPLAQGAFLSAAAMPADFIGNKLFVKKKLLTSGSLGDFSRAFWLLSLPC